MFRFGVFELDPAGRELRKRGVRVRLQEQPCRLLETLLERRGELVSRSALKRALWPDEPAYRTDENLNRVMKRLRATLGDEARNPRFIENVPGKGYRFLGTGSGSEPPKLPRVTIEHRARGPLVGRDGELDRLRRALQKAREGSGSLQLIGGEAGIGKTRLAEETLAIASDEGMHVSFGRCYETSGTPPFQCLIEIFERIARSMDNVTLRHFLAEDGPELAGLVPSLRKYVGARTSPPDLPLSERRSARFTAIRETLFRLGRDRPLVLFVDDLHVADSSTLALLEVLSGELPTEPVLLVGTFRTSRDEQLPDFPSFLEGVIRRRLAEQMTLRPLDAHGVGDVAVARLGETLGKGFIPWLHRLTGGNPFFLEEVLLELDDAELPDEQQLTLPENVKLVLERRFSRLEKGTLETLRAAAIVGSEFTVEALLGMGLDNAALAVEAGEKRGVVRVSGSPGNEAAFGFEHDLIRYALASDLTPARRRELHHALARWMIRRKAKPSRIAHHLVEAGPLAQRAELARYLAEAAEQAMAASASEEALRHAERGLALEPLEAALRARLLLQRGEAEASLQRWDLSVRDLRAALPLFEAAGDSHAVARVVKGLCVIFAWLGKNEEALALLERAETAVGKESTPDRCHILTSHGVTHAMFGDYDEAAARLDEAEGVANTLDDPALRATALFYRANLHQFYMEGSQYEEAAVEAAKTFSSMNLWDGAVALAIAQHALVVTGKLQRAAELTDAYWSKAQKTGHPGALMLIARSRAYLEWTSRGDMEAQTRFAYEDLETVRRVIPHAVVMAHCGIALQHFWEGDWSAAREHCRLAVATEGRGPGMWSGAAAGTRLKVEGAMGEPGLKTESFAPRALELMPTPGAPHRVGRWFLLCRGIEGLADLGMEQEAADLYDRVLELMEKGTVIILWGDGLVEKAAAIAAAAGRKWPEAETHFRNALHLADTMPFRIEQGEVRRWYARALLARDGSGDAARARELLDEAIAVYRDIGMPKHIAMTERLLTRAEAR